MPAPAVDTFRPRGSSLGWSVDDATAQAAITIPQASASVAVWRQLVPAAYRDLPLAATIVDAGQLESIAATSKFFFDLSRQLYGIRATGRYLPPDVLKRAMNTFSANAATRMQVLARQMGDGTISIGEWQAQMAEQLKALHSAATIVGRGGLENVGVDDLLFTQGELKFQYERLERFARQIKAGERTASGIEVIERRVGLYGDAINPTFESAKRDGARSAQMHEERRVLGDADHCPTCIEQAALGWSPMDTLNEIGDSECEWRCKCHFEFRRPEVEHESADTAAD